ncbi:MAG: YbfB/YjiJ family MFS transporter [Pseudomonadota bacterium]|nr:YbfB/YjiJ family MFS transporter [Pseudomonadota bacterium]
MRKGFWCVAALSLGPAVSNSFARFAYALILPSMRADLGWSYTLAGWLNTANALGYLIGALFTIRYVSQLGNRRMFCVAMFVTAAALVGSGLTGSFGVMFVFRFIAGVSGATVFICGGVLASNVFARRPSLAPAAIAIYFAGAGVGILVSGTGVPWLLEVHGDAAWADAWLAIGLVSVVFAIVAALAALRIEETSSGSRDSRWQAAAFPGALAGYFLFGLGYIAYMTFIVAWMKSHGAGALEVASTWAALGMATMLAPLAWRVPLSRWDGGRVLAAACAVTGVGALVPLLSTSLSAMIASAACFGGGMFTAPAAITALVKRSLPKTSWGAAVAGFTAVFAVGQSIGPILTGWLADATDSLRMGLLASAVVLLLAAAVATRQRFDGGRASGNMQEN